MKKIIAMLCGLIAMLAISFAATAQTRTITVVLQDSSTGEAVGYATVSLAKQGSTSAFKYALSDDKGKATIEKVPAGSYVCKAELLGYKTFSKEITLKESLNLGVIKMDPDKQVLDAASVSATGNPIVIKKEISAPAICTNLPILSIKPAAGITAITVINTFPSF